MINIVQIFIEIKIEGLSGEIQIVQNKIIRNLKKIVIIEINAVKHHCLVIQVNLEQVIRMLWLLMVNLNPKV